MNLTYVATFAVVGTALIAGAAILPTVAAQAPESRFAVPRQFVPVGANNNGAWFIDVQAQKVIACAFKGDPKNLQISCKTGSIPQ